MEEVADGWFIKKTRHTTPDFPKKAKHNKHKRHDSSKSGSITGLFGYHLNLVRGRQLPLSEQTEQLLLGAGGGQTNKGKVVGIDGTSA